MEFVTYQRFRTIEEAEDITKQLKDFNIEYRLEKIVTPVDITFTGGNETENKIELRINPDNFDFVDELMSNVTSPDMQFIDETHFLHEFTNKEMIDMFRKYDEWNRLDLTYARELLKKRGYDITDEQIKKFKDDRIEELRKPENVEMEKMYRKFAYVVLGGFPPIIDGLQYMNTKKQLPNGETVYSYDKETRRTGLWLFVTGIIGFMTFLLIAYYRFLHED
jgi:hypothetical protein